MRTRDVATRPSGDDADGDADPQPEVALLRRGLGRRPLVGRAAGCRRRRPRRCGASSGAGRRRRRLVGVRPCGQIGHVIPPASNVPLHGKRSRIPAVQRSDHDGRTRLTAARRAPGISRPPPGTLRRGPGSPSSLVWSPATAALMTSATPLEHRLQRRQESPRPRRWCLGCRVRASLGGRRHRLGHGGRVARSSAARTRRAASARCLDEPARVRGRLAVVAGGVAGRDRRAVDGKGPIRGQPQQGDEGEGSARWRDMRLRSLQPRVDRRRR